MHRTLPLLAFVAVVALAGCLGGLGLGGSSDDPTTTTTTPTSTETMQTATSTPAATTTTTTTQTTTATQTTQTTQQPTQTTTMWTRTTAQVDAPKGSNRFEARVTTIIAPNTITITHGGKTQTVDLIGVKAPKSGLMHKRALQTTQAQLAHSTVTVVTDPTVEADRSGHLQAYLYTGNWLYNTQLIRSGYARVPDTQFSKQQEFAQKQRQAKQRGYGIWNTTTSK